MRYIIIDHNTGYIWGDSADFAAGKTPKNIIEACRMLDEDTDSMAVCYREVPRFDFTNDSGYDVYRADEAMPIVEDGQNQQTIEAVTRDCELLGHVKIIPANEAILEIVNDVGFELAKGLVARWSNAAEVDIDEMGEVWIRGVGGSTGSWLDEEDKAEFVSFCQRA